ncbi:PqqD family protein [Streptomyces sp. NBC_01142]|uniref:PqqD family protein n=1 Tax=Streptomyces sp. NBC_01142 TaxID=2975865 RepID=UPI002250C87F|nr:PqqD family protein [Streptomyces sp. NBC_01142]MCX4827005.1 PqqD family protein [Streptomyces sp. NBC_01142]
MRTAVLNNLMGALPEHDVPAVEECATTLYNALPRQDEIEQNTVMVAYGGGKDSAYAVAFVRAVHLALAERCGATFKLRVVTMRHGGMPYQVMLNIDRTYRALGLYDDPDVELLLVEGGQVVPFDRDRSMPHRLIAFNRTDMLMSGHRSYGDGRATFCNACNLNVANSFGVAARHGGGVDLIITGDSPQEQRDYALWIRQLARGAGQKPADAKKGFKGTLETLDGLAQAYFQEIHGSENAERVKERGVTSDIPALEFFSIYDYTSYASGAHWKLLTDFLGFVFDEIAFNFTESDCANPALMAHLRGLRTERVYQRTYQEGIAQYVDFALELMRRKHFPEHLVEEIANRYRTEAGVESMRTAATRYGEDAFGVDTRQLVCMVYSPFAGGAANLHDYLAGELPELLPDEDRIRALLAGKEDHGALAARLERISGLSLTDLRALHDGPLWSPFAGMATQAGVLPLVMDSDPHKKIIKAKRNPEGEEVLDRVAGR